MIYSQKPAKIKAFHRPCRFYLVNIGMLNFSSTASNLTSMLEIVMTFGTNTHGAQRMNPGDFEGFWWNISVLPCWPGTKCSTLRLPGGRTPKMWYICKWNIWTTIGWTAMKFCTHIPLSIFFSDFSVSSTIRSFSGNVCFIMTLTST